MSRPLTTPESRSRRRKATLALIVAVIALLGWVAAIAALTGGGQDTVAGKNASDEQPVESPETTRQVPQTTQKDQEGDKDPETAEDEPENGEKTDNSGGSEGSEGADGGHAGDGEETKAKPAPSVATPESASGDWSQGDAPEGEPVLEGEVEGGEGANDSHASQDAQDSGGSETDSRDQKNQEEQEEQQEEPKSPTNSENSGSSEQQVFDPLGKNPEPGDLTQTDEERAKSTADRFITSAYGYTGNSEKEYTKGVMRSALGMDLYRSPGGKRIKKYAEAAGEDGITSAAVMDSFEITETTPERVMGTAHFRVGREYNQYAELEGDTTPFTQELTLAPVGKSYRVIEASVEKEANGKEQEGGG